MNAIAVVVGSLCFIVVIAILAFAFALCRLSKKCDARDVMCLACGREFNSGERMTKQYYNAKSKKWDIFTYHCPYCYSDNLLDKKGNDCA